MSDGFQIISFALIVTHAERDHAADIPLSASTYPRQSDAYETHAAVYAHLDRRHTNDAPATAGRVELAQAVAS